MNRPGYLQGFGMFGAAHPGAAYSRAKNRRDKLKAKFVKKGKVACSGLHVKLLNQKIVTELTRIDKYNWMLQHRRLSPKKAKKLIDTTKAKIEKFKSSIRSCGGQISPEASRAPIQAPSPSLVPKALTPKAAPKPKALPGLAPTITPKKIGVIPFVPTKAGVPDPTIFLPTGFDEAKYLARHPDVALAVSQGIMPSGAYHYAMYGMGIGCKAGANCDPKRRDLQGYWFR